MSRLYGDPLQGEESSYDSPTTLDEVWNPPWRPFTHPLQCAAFTYPSATAQCRPVTYCIYNNPSNIARSYESFARQCSRGVDQNVSQAHQLFGVGQTVDDELKCRWVCEACGGCEVPKEKKSRVFMSTGASGRRYIVPTDDPFANSLSPPDWAGHRRNQQYIRSGSERKTQITRLVLWLLLSFHE